MTVGNEINAMIVNTLTGSLMADHRTGRAASSTSDEPSGDPQLYQPPLHHPPAVAGVDHTADAVQQGAGRTGPNESTPHRPQGCQRASAAAVRRRSPDRSARSSPG